MIKTLAVFSSVDGQTKRICQRITEMIEADHDVTLIDLNTTKSIDLTECEKVILGGSVRYGKHHPRFERFLSEQYSSLNAKKLLVFSVNATARKTSKRSPMTNPYFIKLKQKTCIKAEIEAVFAGKLHLAKCSLFDRIMIKLIFKMSGEHIGNSEVEFTDWEQVDCIADEFRKL